MKMIMKGYMMKDKRSKNKGILTKIKKAGHRPSKIICPVCKKDLTEALKLVCADFSTHMEVHLQIDTLKIFTYLYCCLRKPLPLWWG